MVPRPGGSASRGAAACASKPATASAIASARMLWLFHDVSLLWVDGARACAHACALSSADWSDWMKARLVRVAPETIWIFEL